jgi:hypothetical protein
MGEEITKPTNTTYWIITDGINYGDGVTGVDQVTSVGNGWTIHWQGINYNDYVIECQKINLIPSISVE